MVPLPLLRSPSQTASAFRVGIAVLLDRNTRFRPERVGRPRGAVQIVRLGSRIVPPPTRLVPQEARMTDAATAVSRRGLLQFGGGLLTLGGLWRARAANPPVPTARPIR